MIQEKRDIQRKLPFYFSFNLGWKGVKDLKVVLLKERLTLLLDLQRAFPQTSVGRALEEELEM